MDGHDALVDCLEKSQTYPCNLLRVSELKRTLRDYHQILKNEEKGLFDELREHVYFLDLHDGEDDFVWNHTQSPKVLKQHLDQNVQDPRCRFIFLETVDSRSGLKCSAESFCHALSFHQVPARFLDFSLSFKKNENPIDYHMIGFRGDDTLDMSQDRLLQIPRLGRSGCEHQMQYLLRSVESATKKHDGSITWNIRQMAVHHSFDLSSGKALWINMKTNDVMRQRLTEATNEYPEMRPKALSSIAQSFSSTLLIHLIHLDWCDEKWRSCINDFEGQIREILAKGETARVDRQTELGATALKRAITMQQNSRNATMTDPSKPSEGSSFGGFLSTLFRSDANKSAMTNTKKLPVPAVDEKTVKPAVSGDDQLSKQMEDLKVLDTFSFKEMQRLHWLGEQLENFRLVLDLNDQCFRDIVEHYEELFERKNFPQIVKDECGQELATFVRRVNRLRKNLEIRSAQVRSLIVRLQDGKSLYRSFQVDRISTEISQDQQSNMEEIAYKTEKETISMHIITGVTLLFLPGTFMAAFFQSGLVDVNSNATGLTDAVIFHRKAFELFATICFPLMLITSFVWIALFMWLSRRAAQRPKKENQA